VSGRWPAVCSPSCIFRSHRRAEAFARNLAGGGARTVHGVQLPGVVAGPHRRSSLTSSCAAPSGGLEQLPTKPATPDDQKPEFLLARSPAKTTAAAGLGGQALPAGPGRACRHCADPGSRCQTKTVLDDATPPPLAGTASARPPTPTVFPFPGAVSPFLGPHRHPPFFDRPISCRASRGAAKGRGPILTYKPPRPPVVQNNNHSADRLSTPRPRGGRGLCAARIGIYFRSSASDLSAYAAKPPGAQNQNLRRRRMDQLCPWAAPGPCGRARHDVTGLSATSPCPAFRSGRAGFEGHTRPPRRPTRRQVPFKNRGLARSPPFSAVTCLRRESSAKP